MKSRIPSLTSLAGIPVRVRRVPDVRKETERLGYEAGNENLAGVCLRNPKGKKGMEILVDSTLPLREQSSTFLHEVIHALFPDLSESMVLKIERGLFPILWRRGFRPFGEQDE